MTAPPRPERFFLPHNPEDQGVEVKLQGVVQGVGFRPFVHRLAGRFGFSGTVINSAEGVVIRLAPPLSRLDSFVFCLQNELPPLARITSLEITPAEVPPRGPGFFILESDRSGRPSTMIPPDAAVCADCLAELFNPGDRRYLYPFINCTNCGPRLTIVSSIPYDRPNTSMHVFPMCPSCAGEYHDPADRRFHAQPDACWQCGPRLSWHDGEGRLITCDDPLAAAIGALGRGCVVAMRGLGGFHLAVDAGSEEAVQKLRQRKKRPSKPLAVMAPDLATARNLCVISAEEEQLLCSWRRPIVLLPRKDDSWLASSLAPGIAHLGLMLPYTPFHHLLFRVENGPHALVMTSGNRSDEPICTANSAAVESLAGIADFFLLHNRDIVTRVDDSVIRVMGGKGRVLRRARGYVPEALALGWHLPEVLACGAELKNTFCLVRGGEAFLSQHIGDLSSVETLEFFAESVRHMQNILDFTPAAVACDLHPDYLSSRFAEKLGLPLVRVQHHHAHAVAVMAEHGLADDTFAVILDGSGYGLDGGVWGGEILLAGLTSFTRLASLEEMMLPGGDAAAREPWRMAMAALWLAYGREELAAKEFVPALAKVEAAKRNTLLQMMEKQINTPLTSSCGRLFDAVSAMLDLRIVSDYEGQAAMELEALAWQEGKGAWPGLISAAGDFPVVLAEEQGRMVIKTGQLVRALVDALAQNRNRGELALAFHRWLVISVTEAITTLGARLGRKKVVLGGGCLQNGLLLSGLLQNLEAAGYEVFAGEKAPANDGGISLGQAVIAGMKQLAEKRSGVPAFQRLSG
ncbi:MAG: carbamoyltransferase HypF [Deltaproteobacteria bacterium]|nr:carbamoyltransferase HypF [Deltaproteobacteria bacterium]